MSDEDEKTIGEKLDKVLLCLEGDEKMGIEGVIPRQKKTEKKVSRLELALWTIIVGGGGAGGLTIFDLWPTILP